MSGVETSITDHPYMAGLEVWGTFTCAATVIKKSWAMTAAHCVRGNEGYGEIWLRVGTSDREYAGWLVAVDKVVRHAEKRPNDIALLHTQTEFPIGDLVKVVTLPLSSNKVENGTVGTILGWGKAGPGENSPPKLRKMEMIVDNYTWCVPGAGFDVTEPEAIICARPKTAGTDVCNGDSGGPLTYGDRQIGIISRASCTGASQAVVLFTNVAYFRDWIDDETK
ncbi:trypsin-2-like [Schistocerca piceifrons]|uniref:trypsin-2-like n=1 Tax=Schistocerca piceifrons TaxID=274613 RepID=UPI001F5F1EB8|nr:trypsin-2-like [Schistocerca piceifrons]